MRMMSLTPHSSPLATDVPVRKIPGSYGAAVVGPMWDRLDYFWLQGPETFFRRRMERHNSSVFRTNVPPTFPFFKANPNVVALLDTVSFAHMFDMDLVEKKDILVGDFMPSLSFTGGLRVGPYLDTTEPKHSQVKNFAMDILKRSSDVWVSELSSSLTKFWDIVEEDLSKNSSSTYLINLQKFLFEFLSKCMIGADPNVSPQIAENGYRMIDLWLAFQLLPTINVGLVQPLEEIFLHSFPYPFFLVSGGYNKLYNFILQNGKEVIERGTKVFGLSEEEAIHNLIFIIGFNAFGGFSIFLPDLLANVFSNSNSGLQQRLFNEVKSLSDTEPITFESIKSLKLINSVVYETLRLRPPVPLQYARARKDFLLRSHDSAFEVKKGELLCGFQALVMRDPKVFSNPDKFDPDRFKNDESLLDYLFWSNGPQTGTPTTANKQCAGKDIVTLTAALFLALTFRRYSSISGSGSSITALQRAK